MEGKINPRNDPRIAATNRLRKTANCNKSIRCHPWIKFVAISALFVAIGGIKTASAASLYFSPSSDTRFLSRTFNVGIYVSSADAAMNAADGTISFPSDKVEIVSISKSGTIVNFWVQEPSFSNRDGMINFAGIVTNPGFQGSSGKLLTITFRANGLGKANLSFLSGSILANDGAGTNILSSLGSATINIAEVPANAVVETQGQSQGIPPPEINSTPPISGSDWYSINSAQFTWKIPSGVDGVEYGFSSVPDYEFSKKSSGLVSESSYDLGEYQDGTLYFSAVFKKGNTWGSPTVKTLQLDRTPPGSFAIERKDEDFTADQPVFQWEANDKTSGIAYYTMKIGDGDWIDASSMEKDSGYLLPPQSATYSGSRTLAVRAYDKAGNFRDSSIEFQVISKTGAQALWYKFLIFLKNWSLLVISATAALVALLYLFIFRLMAWRRKLKKEIGEFKDELRHDLKRLEVQLNEEAESDSGMEINLKPAHLEKRRGAIQKEIKHLQEDVKTELKKLEKFGGK